jgi:hypothetical protein
MEKLIILDFMTGECHCYTLVIPTELVDDMYDEYIEDKIEALGHNISNVEYMVTANDIIVH